MFSVLTESCLYHTHPQLVHCACKGNCSVVFWQEFTSLLRQQLGVEGFSAIWGCAGQPHQDEDTVYGIMHAWR